MKKAILIILIIFEVFLISSLFSPTLINRREHAEAVVEWIINPTPENRENYEKETFTNKKIVFIHNSIICIVLFFNSWSIINIYKKIKSPKQSLKLNSDIS